MSKKRKAMSALPTMDRTAKPKVEPVKPKEPQQVVTVDVPMITITVPMLAPDMSTPSYQNQSRRFDAGTLTREEMYGIKSLRAGLSTLGYRTTRGDEVQTNTDAVRFLLGVLVKAMAEASESSENRMK